MSIVESPSEKTDLLVLFRRYTSIALIDFARFELVLFPFAIWFHHRSFLLPLCVLNFFLSSPPGPKILLSA
jgi:hypothetical protein